MNTHQVFFKRLTTSAQEPKYSTALAAGMDLHADFTGGANHALVFPGKAMLIKTGIAIILPNYLEAQIRSRSGLALKAGIIVLNAPGTIDPDYRGDVGVILFNTGAAGSAPFEVKQGDRIAQLVIAPFVRAVMHEVEELPETERGEGGFGSTGLRLKTNSMGLNRMVEGSI